MLNMHNKTHHLLISLKSQNLETEDELSNKNKENLTCMNFDDTEENKRQSAVCLN